MLGQHIPAVQKPAPQLIPRAYETGKIDPGWIDIDGLSINAAELDALSNALSVETKARVIADDALRAAIDAVSAAVPTVSVTSAELASVDARVTSVASIASAAASAVNALSVVVSNHTSAIAANSAQMASADNAISAAAAAVSARLDSTNTVVSNQGSAIVANSAQMTSADNALSAAINVVSNALSNEISVRTSAVNAVSNRLSTWTLDNLADVSAPAPADGNTILWNSAQAQWVASAPPAGAGSVTSAELQAVSAAAASADGTLSVRVDSVMTIVSNHTSAIQANSAQMTSADNAISAAAAAVSARLDSTNTVVSNQGSAIVANSAQMTSADNALSAAINVVSNAASNALSVANAVSNRLSTWAVDNLADVSAPSPTDGQVLMWRSTSVQWVASTPAAGAGSVTSAELVDATPTKHVLAGAQVVSATAPVSLSGFTFTCSAGVGYKFEFGIFTSNPISAAGNKFVLSFPSSSPVVAIYQQGGAVGGVSTLNADRTNVTMANVTVSAVGVPIAAYIRGTFRCSANGGTMALAMGNNVSGAGAGSAITVLAGSYGYVWRMV